MSEFDHMDYEVVNLGFTIEAKDLVPDGHWEKLNKVINSWSVVPEDEQDIDVDP